MFETVGSAVYEFILGRGLTLVLALIAGIVLWYLMRALRRLVRSRRQSVPDRQQAARIRLLAYGYHLLTIVLVAFAVLSVFYLRGDVLLLSLAIIALVMLALGVWRFLPGYVREARLLLNAGAAREGERVIYNGLPYRIASLNLYSELRNPELEGTVRLPLATLSQLISRPAGEEDWFPCSVGDYLLLPDGSFAQVLQQSVERVQLKVVGSIQRAQPDARGIWHHRQLRHRLSASVDCARSGTRAIEIRFDRCLPAGRPRAGSKESGRGFQRRGHQFPGLPDLRDDGRALRGLVLCNSTHDPANLRGCLQPGKLDHPVCAGHHPPGRVTQNRGLLLSARRPAHARPAAWARLY
jgi:hypothetical protein